MNSRWLVLLLVVGLVVGFTSIAGRPTSSVQAQLPHRVVLPNLAADGAPEFGNYQVRPGETLRAIAHRHHTSAQVIASLNGVGLDFVPRAGQLLFVPDPPAPRTSTLVSSGNRASNKVALTFDMGGRVDPALDIMNFLKANNVRATIFMTGAMVNNQNTNAGRQVLQFVEANLDLFELGNHSYNHPDFTTLSADGMRSELNSTQAAIDQYISLKTAPLFRPPFGAWDNRVLDVIGQAGYTETIMWDIDTIDWRPESEGGPTTAQIINKVVNNAQGGSIVLMHLGGYNTLAALPAMVDGLRARGFDLATVGEVLAER